MKLVGAIGHVAIMVLITLNACGGQIKSEAISNPEQGPRISSIDTLVKTTEGIVYFSYDNGLTWEDKSSGLSPATSIGLGGIAVSENKLGLLSKDSGLYLFNVQEDRWHHIPTDKRLLASNPGALIFYNNRIYAGTQTGGVFSSKHSFNWSLYFVI